MNIVLFMIIVSLFIAIIFFILFIKSVKSGQYDDLYTPSVRMLFDDEIIEKKEGSLEDKKSINQINNE
jgi:cbb3-type cytochrome oxidase maturation protein